jgi:gas vesicle protein
MKYLALLLSITTVGFVGCQQTPQIPEQYEPAFASDDFGTSVQDDVEELGEAAQEQASTIGSSLKEKANNFKSAMQKEVNDLKSDVNDFADATADQFEPLDE